MDLLRFPKSDPNSGIGYAVFWGGSTFWILSGVWEETHVDSLHDKTASGKL